jgi:hypothetical protein
MQHVGRSLNFWTQKIDASHHHGHPSIATGMSMVGNVSPRYPRWRRIFIKCAIYPVSSDARMCACFGFQILRSAFFLGCAWRLANERFVDGPTDRSNDYCHPGIIHLLWRADMQHIWNETCLWQEFIGKSRCPFFRGFRASAASIARGTITAFPPRHSVPCKPKTSTSKPST